MKPYKGFMPDWYTKKVDDKSYRSIYKWGDPKYHKIPKENLYILLKEKFNLTDDDFKKHHELGLETVEYNIQSKITKEQIDFFKNIVGSENVKTDDYTRLKVAYGKTMYDLLRLRKGIVENVPDIVVYPRSKDEIEQIVAYCKEQIIPIYVFGGGSTVTRGVECMKGGISLDISKNFNKVVSFNETDQTITVESGISGPKLEQLLNNAPEAFNAKRRYSCGHFPQSFEYSVVGGWVVTRGAGQNSTYYGKIEDLVLGQCYATPIGNIETDSYPAKATGPSIDQIMIGSEGAYGILTHVTLKVFRHQPQNRYRFSYMFKNWETAQEAAREVMQSEIGKPSVFRLSDPEETDVMMRLYGIDKTPLNGLLKLLGYNDNKCLLLGFTDGEKGYGKNVYKNIKKIARKYKGLFLTSFPTKAWEKGRFTDPYLRDSLQDYGIMLDTLECTVNWSNMNQVYHDVREVCKSRPNTVCMSHMSHVYPQGANLYFIFITKMDCLEEFKTYHSSILDAIQRSKATMSHHHGIGKMFAPWLKGQIGINQHNVFKALKNHFDPNNIMNPGGTLGLDIDEEEMQYSRIKW